jgi:hypothetical protein
MSMRQGEIGDGRPADSDRLLLLRELPREAGSHFEQLASAPPVLNPDGGTDYVPYRKDRVQCVRGQEYLGEHRLKPDFPIRRVIATCCDSGMFLDFTKGQAVVFACAAVSSDGVSGATNNAIAKLFMASPTRP